MNEYIKNLTLAIENALISELDPKRGVLEEALYYALSVKGKRLRPLLFLTLVEAYRMNPLEYLDIACALESIHTYSLIHDDLPCMDNDDFRRGMPTLHKKYSEAIALLTGDTLLTYAFERISRSSLPPVTLVNMIRILTLSIGKDGMAGGQVLDLEFKGNKESIFQIHRMKTGELIKATLRCAAQVVNMSETDEEILTRAASFIGMAFQMADDLLDIEGDEKEVGKKLKKDLDNKSPNCVLFYGSDFIKKEIDSAYHNTILLLKQLNIQFPPFLYLIEKMVYRSK